MDGEPGVTHNGVRADDVVDPTPIYSAPLLRTRQGGRRADLIGFDSVGMTKQQS